MTTISRRTWLKTAGASWLLVESERLLGAIPSEADRYGVVGHKQSAEAGLRVLADGGNAIDAVVCASLVAGVVAVPSCGIGGYGGHAIVALPNGQITAIDFNSAAPAAAREDMFPLDDQGQVPGRINDVGWLAAGVPGTLAGLQLAADKWGTRPLSALLQPAIRFARDGFPAPSILASTSRSRADSLMRDPCARKLLLPGDQPMVEGATFRNPELAEMLRTLAGRNSFESFYRGDVAQQIAAAFQRHGGLVTAADLAAYRAREVEPLSFSWGEHTAYTPPLTSGGLSVFQALGALKALGWEAWQPGEPRTLHAWVEALRIAWHDRIALLGDPEETSVPVERLLSTAYAEQCAARVREAVERRTMIPGESDSRRADGTIHLTACDRDGMMASLTLSHGNAFGACVAVEGLGLILGHGMSRFDPRPGLPNSPRPGSRPLNNMCPTIVCHQGRPVVALGGTGARRIPNRAAEVLAEIMGRGRSLADGLALPRLHTEGGKELCLTTGFSKAQRRYLEQIGYQLSAPQSVNLTGVSRDPETGRLTISSRPEK